MYTLIIHGLNLNYYNLIGKVEKVKVVRISQLMITDTHSLTHHRLCIIELLLSQLKSTALKQEPCFGEPVHLTQMSVLEVSVLSSQTPRLCGDIKESQLLCCSPTSTQDFMDRGHLDEENDI